MTRSEPVILRRPVGARRSDTGSGGRTVSARARRPAPAAAWRSAWRSWRRGAGRGGRSRPTPSSRRIRSSTIGAISSGFLRWACRLVARHRGRRVEDADLEGLVAAATLGDAELDAGAGLERGDPVGQRVGVHVDVGAVLLGQEAEALLGVEPLHLASGHGLNLFLICIARPRRAPRQRASLCRRAGSRQRLRSSTVTARRSASFSEPDRKPRGSRSAASKPASAYGVQQRVRGGRPGREVVEQQGAVDLDRGPLPQVAHPQVARGIPASASSGPARPPRPARRGPAGTVSPRCRRRPARTGRRRRACPRWAGPSGARPRGPAPWSGRRRAAA